MGGGLGTARGAGRVEGAGVLGQWLQRKEHGGQLSGTFNTRAVAQGKEPPASAEDAEGSVSE